MKKLLTVMAVLAAVMISGCNKSSSNDSASDSTAAAEKSLLQVADDSNFDAIIAQGVVLVDFWAPWCPPCRVQLPLVEKAAEQLDGKAKVVKLNVDEGKQAAAKFGVSSIPTLIVFKDGKEVKKFVGVTQPDELIAAVNAAL